MNYTSRYIDPATGSYVYEDGVAKRISAKLARVGMILMTSGLTVPGSEALTCRLRSIKTVDPLRVCAEIDRVLRPYQTRQGVDGLFDSYTRRAWSDGARGMWISVTITNAGADETFVASLAA